MADILLINPRVPGPDRERYQRGFMPPLMLGYLASPLLEKGFNVEIIDMMANEIGRTGLQEIFKMHSPCIVGITCTTESYSNCLRIAKLAKDNKPDSKVVVGGPHVTFTFEETLKNPYIDFVVRGEGDHTFLELVEFLMTEKGSREEIKGIAFCEAGKVVQTGLRPLMKDIDVLPWPARHLLDMSQYDTAGCLFSARGCPGKCIFCAERAMAGGRFRIRNVQNVVDEMEYLAKELMLDYLFFNDETLTALPARTEELCDLANRQGLRVQWGCESRVDVVDSHLLRKMADAGCTNIQFGGESGSNRVLRSIRKGITVDQIENAVKQSAEVGINSVCNFMIGHPEDTRESIHETIDFMKKLAKYDPVLALAICVPFPGTYIFNHAKEIGVDILSDDWDEFQFSNAVMNTKHLTASEIRSLYFDAETELAPILW